MVTWALKEGNSWESINESASPLNCSGLGSAIKGCSYCTPFYFLIQTASAHRGYLRCWEKESGKKRISQCKKKILKEEKSLQLESILHEACRSMFCLFTTHSLLLSVMPPSKRKTIIAEWGLQQRSYGCSAVCISRTYQFCKWDKKAWKWPSMESKKKPKNIKHSLVSFSLLVLRCIFVHRRALVVSSRWVAGNSSGWRFFS